MNSLERGFNQSFNNLDAYKPRVDLLEIRGELYFTISGKIPLLYLVR